ncbi:efflux RND transporter permease subunit [Hydrogenophaga palleronii]|uniref:efflux RND transporter permease subunit n=1 Tax=Hydrogenophaga palleronii TaxID=65655 RepID=UPI000825B924|nr:efflux RND transporter permease subunit [Hydrogenophaga palleronii]
MDAVARYFIRRPVASIMLAVAVLLAGALAWRLLPVAPLPQVDFPAIEISANLPGASPESMAATVAAPLERALGSIAGVARIASSSNQGATRVNLDFELGRNIDEAAREVQAAINAARGQLPSGMSGNPSFRKVNPSQAPIMALALSSPQLPPSVLYDNASTVLAQKLSQIVGVGEVRVDGASLPAVRVQLDGAALTHLGLSMEDVRRAIGEANAWRPLGAIEHGAQRWQIALSQPMRSAADFAQLVVRHDQGALVRLSDVARVTDSVENRYTSGYHNQRTAVVLLVSRRADANIVQTLDAIYEQMPQLRALLPADTQLSVVMDRSPGIRATLAEAQWTLLIACVLVMLVVWAFLGRARTALIPALALPVSLVGTFTVMWWLGFSLNNLSLMALIVAAGLVVDDAIVVLENVQRHIERQRHAGGTGQTRFGVWRAAMRGAGEVGFTLLAMNLALVVVFVAILFMGGVIERLFREFSLTLAAAILISLAVSLSLTPALCAHTLPAQDRAPGRLALAGREFFASLQRGYLRSLDWVLRHGVVALLVLAGVVALNVWLYNISPKGMLPTQDTGQLSAFVRGDDGFSYQVMQPKVEAYRQYLLADPAVADVTGTAGARTGISNAAFRVRLKPLAERDPAPVVAQRLRSTAPLQPGAMLFVNVEQDIRLQAHGGGDGEQTLVLRSDSLQTLRQWARPVGDALQRLPELVDVNVPGGEDAQQVELTIDREAARRYGVEMASVASALNNAFSQRQVATLYDDLNQYRVVMELDPLFGSDPSALAQVQVMNHNAQPVPLSAFAQWQYGLSQDRVQHDAQFASIGVDYGLAPGVTLPQAQQAIERALDLLMLPSNIYAGERKEDRNGLKATLARQPWLILGVLVAVYLVLGVLYESTLHPLTILSTLPSAGVGALLALRLAQMEFSLIALLGLFLLIGVVMKNAILLIDFALDAQRRGGLMPLAAVREAARLRLRPILMTNLAALLGAVPLVLGFGEGSEMRRPLGVAIIGGLAVSQLLTLYTTPVVYLYLERLRQWSRRATPSSSPSSSPAAP